MNANHSESPKSLIEAVRHFSDIDRCNEKMVQVRWSDGRIVCPKCGSDRIGKIETRKMLRCKDCRKQFSYKAGTIFEDSPLGLDKWFVAVWSIANCKNGVSSAELARSLGVTQKSAWHMLHRIRLAMQTGSFSKMGGPGVEMECDETFVGGKAKNMHKAKRGQRVKGRGTVGKIVVQGLLERGGRVRCGVVPNQKRATLQGKIRKHVEPGTTVYTDALASYCGLDAEYVHQMIDHAKCYVEGRVHTNGIENFWSCVKRCLNGTYISVSPWQLYRYLDEQAFRFNERKACDAERFSKVLSSVIGKRLTYVDLVEG
ncbi:MAG: IS1595 family transposase [Planctomycetaceae bacterium]